MLSNNLPNLILPSAPLFLPLFLILTITKNSHYVDQFYFYLLDLN